jgi:hypothetical protein
MAKEGFGGVLWPHWGLITTTIKPGAGGSLVECTSFYSHVFDKSLSFYVIETLFLQQSTNAPWSILDLQDGIHMMVLDATVVTRWAEEKIGASTDEDWGMGTSIEL